MASVVAAESDPAVAAEQTRLFETSIRPLLASKCVRCHGADKQESDLRLDSRDSMLAGGLSGPAVVPGQPGKSLLIEAVNYASLEMPPEGQLAAPQIDALTRWIGLGAPWPADNATIERSQAELTPQDRLHWSFQPVRRVEPPAADHSSWCRNHIDAFVLEKLQGAGLQPAPPAEPAVLVRRVFLTLLGLPPTAEQLDAYLADTAADKYERLVDRLLADTRYGEKWARHWLDIVRFAESDGWRQDAFRAEAFRYRDYVVASFNADKPYDLFLREQLAGDELDPGNPDAITATALLRLGTYEYNQRDVETQWSNILDELTDVTGDALLGLGIACARCHDHKFDPILQEDYFRLRAMFEPLVWREDQPQATIAQRLEHQRQWAQWQRQTAAVQRELDELEWPVRLRTAGGQGFDKFAPHLQAMLLKLPADRTPAEQQLALLALRQLEMDDKKLEAALTRQQRQRRAELQTRLAQFKSLLPAPLPVRKFAVSDVAAVAPPTRIPGDPNHRVIQPGYLSVLDWLDTPPIEPPPAVLQSTGRRTALAKWLTSPAHPLTARVMVNRVWQHHFGAGLVATPNDFGRLGESPSHPELLDWLAAQLIADGWRLKSLQRLIVTSAVFRQASVVQSSLHAQQVDPRNRLLWHMPTRRLDAEQIRDAMLQVSGELDAHVGGPSVPFDVPRRSLYVRVIRNARDPLFDLFDMADGFSSAGLRIPTTTPLQSLLLINGPFTLQRARLLAARLRQQCGTEATAAVSAAYRAVLGRSPTAQELAEGSDFVRRQAAMTRNSTDADAGSLVDLCHVLLNTNEFLFLD